MLTQRGPRCHSGLCVSCTFSDCFHLEVQDEEGEREAGGGDAESQPDELGRKPLPVVPAAEPLPPLVTPAAGRARGAESRPLLQRALRPRPGAQRAPAQGAALGGPGAGEMPAASGLRRDQGEGGALRPGAGGGLRGRRAAAGAHPGGVAAGAWGRPRSPGRSWPPEAPRI